MIKLAYCAPRHAHLAGELPVQARIKFQAVLNLKAAKTLGVEFPSMLAASDEVIE
jgi:hypothetical protein